MGQQHGKEDDVSKKKKPQEDESKLRKKPRKPRPGSLMMEELSHSGRQLLLQALNVEVSPPDKTTPSSGLQTTGESLTPSEAAPTTSQISLEDIRKREENQTCADCSEPSSTWASATFGVFLCLSCVGAHRSLGSDVSFTRSTTLDASGWTRQAIEKMDTIGNQRSNELFEFHVPAKWPKPSAETPGSYRREYVKVKYKDQLFTQHHNPGVASQPPVPWCKRKNMLLRPGSVYMDGKREYIGIVSVTVVAAESLTPVNGAIPLPQAPAFYTNPYCVVRLGKYEAKTKCVHRSLNPTWNEGPGQNVQFNMSWDGSTELHLAVWNHDKLGKDKPIGSAVVDITALADRRDGSSVEELWVRVFHFRDPASSTRRIRLTRKESSDGPPSGVHHAASASVGGDVDLAAFKDAASSSLSSSTSSNRNILGHYRSASVPAAFEQHQQKKTKEKNMPDEEGELYYADMRPRDDSGGNETIVDDDDDEEEAQQEQVVELGDSGQEDVQELIDIPNSDALDNMLVSEFDAQLLCSPVSGLSSPGSEHHQKTSSIKSAGSHLEKGWRHLRKKSITKLHLRNRMKEAIGNLKTVLHTSSRHLGMDEDDELGEARLQLGYHFAGKVLLRLSFTDLR